MPSTNGNTTKRAILYARVSTDDQAEKYGPKYQLRELRKWADDEGYSVAEEVEEPGYSRESWKRPGLDTIRRLAESGFRGDVLAWKRDRYFADPVYRGLFEREMDGYGIRLRAMDDSGADTAEGQLADGIMDLLARLEVHKTVDRSRAGRREKAHSGEYVWSGSPPYGYRYEGGELLVDPATAPNVRRIFELVGRDGMGMNQVRKAFRADGVRSPRGAERWQISTIKRIINNDIYVSRSFEEVAARVAPAVAANLAPEERHALTYYNRRRSKTVHTLEGKTRKITQNDPSDWIAIPVPALSVPPGWVHAARRNVADNTVWQPNEARPWPLRGFVSCPCGPHLLTYYNVRKGYTNAYYICPRRRRGEACEHARYHRAEVLEERVADFVYGLLHDPETLRAEVQARLEAERQELRGSEQQLRALRQELEKAEQETARLDRALIEGRITGERYDRYAADIGGRKRTAERELDRLGDKERRTQELDDLEAQIEDYLDDLPHLVDRSLPVREHETVPPEPLPGDELAIYELSPERIRERTPEEVEELREKRERARSERYRDIYRLLGLKAVAHKDGTLELSWAGGCASLQPSAGWRR